MSYDDDTCDQCNGHIDSMNSEAIARHINGEWRLWCNIQCCQEWVAECQKKKGQS